MTKIDHSPIKPYWYGYVTFNLIEEYETNDTIDFLILEFQCLSKNIISQSEAIKFWKSSATRQDINIWTKQDVENAYIIAYGDGCEYEWFSV